MRRLVTLTLVVAFVSIACGGTDNSDADGPLVLYSGRSEELVGPLIEQFESESGIETEIRYADSSELAATLLAEGEETEADVFFAQDPASLGA
ncbi:MAG TPA: substrate-binding domain-containing protein, partial [Acidimicrobiia bacterium]|nr:substrate-binding domain-containing protein [Acidimicrobiia bacterium]